MGVLNRVKPDQRLPDCRIRPQIPACAQCALGLCPVAAQHEAASHPTLISAPPLIADKTLFRCRRNAIVSRNMLYASDQCQA